MYNFKLPRQNMLFSILFGLSLCCCTSVIAKPSSIRASVGSAVVFMNVGVTRPDLSGRIELEAFKLTSQNPSKSVWVFEIIGMQVPYPAMRRYALEPSFDTTTALFPKGSDFLWGFGAGVRLHLADISGSTIQMRLTAGLSHTRDGMQFGGDHLKPRNPLYLYPSVVLNLHRNAFLTFGTLITELREPQSAIFPIEIGLNLL